MVYDGRTVALALVAGAHGQKREIRVRSAARQRLILAGNLDRAESDDLALAIEIAHDLTTVKCDALWDVLGQQASDECLSERPAQDLGKNRTVAVNSRGRQ